MIRTGLDTDPDLQWLYDCGWHGWVVDEFTGKIHTHHGDEFGSAKELRAWLESLPTWPRVRNVPAKGKVKP